MKNPATSCRSRQAIRPTCIATRISGAPASADSESIPPLQGFERNGRLCQSFRPNVPGSTFGMLAAKRHFSRIECAADKIGVCAMASRNLLEKSQRKTRGFTSCSIPATLPPMNLRPPPAFSFPQWRPAGLAGIAKHIRHAAFKPFQQKFQSFQGDILLTHFHSMKR